MYREDHDAPTITYHSDGWAPSGSDDFIHENVNIAMDHGLRRILQGYIGFTFGYRHMYRFSTFWVSYWSETRKYNEDHGRT